VANLYSLVPTGDSAHGLVVPLSEFVLQTLS
jgi:hypothetical protein